MDCKQVIELLPLFVGSDLEERQSKLLSEHVRWCEKCACSTDEYRQTRWMVQGFAPPPYSDELYTGIREHVLNEIGKEPARTMLSHLVATLFSPSLRWATLSVLLVSAAFFSYYVIGVWKDTNRQIAITHPGDRIVRDDKPMAAPRNDELPLPTNVDDPKPRAISGGAYINRSKRKKRLDKAARPRSAAQISESTSARTAPEINLLPIRDPASSPATVRMEIQTSDPNIRIIWFSPQPPKQASKFISKDS